MTDYPTLNVISDAGGSQTTASRGVETAFLDGYSQTVFVGRKRTTDSMDFTYGDDLNIVAPLYQQLKQYLNDNTAFYYRFGNIDKLRLYKIKKDSLKWAHNTGMKYTIQATFIEWDGLGALT